MGAKTKKRKKLEDSPPSESSDSDSSIEDQSERYATFKAAEYTRKYPENSNKSEFIVFLTHNNDQQSFTDKDRLALSQALRKYCVAGVLHLRSITKFKVGVTFELSNNANVFIQNKKLLDELSLSASIPASATEVTGILRNVPVTLSNKQIFSLIGSSRNIIQVRRFMRRERATDNSLMFVPTQTVGVTFASTQLPEYVYLDSWRHEVSVYVPPVKQCLKCMKFGHIAKFCKNADVCSICSLNHNFKSCNEDGSNAKCANCGGSHIAISSMCPIKKQKLEENKIKAKSVNYADLFNEKTFPHLAAKSVEVQIQNLIKSDTFINLLVEMILKVKKQAVPINSNSIRGVIKDTFSKSCSPIK